MFKVLNGFNIEVVNLNQTNKKITPPFSQPEYERRIHLTRQEMTKRGVDVLFIEDPSNMNWLTGYNGWSFYVHQGVLLFLDKDPVWWGRSQDQQGARLTTFMSDKNIHGYDDNYVQSSKNHPMEDLAKWIREYGCQESTIGLELDNYYFSAKAYLSLKENLQEAKFVDATSLVNWQRMIKSPEEIAFMEKAATIVQTGMEEAIKRIKPGLKKNHLVAEIYSSIIKGTDEIWGDYPAIVPMLPSGYHASAPHLTWDDQIFKVGEGTFLELAGCYCRYHVPLCRTVFLGKPDKKFLNAEKALNEGIAAGIEVARPGAKASDVAKELYASLKRYQIEREGRCGYGIGVSYPPDWGERTISLRKNDDSILEAGMTFHFMPGLWMDSWGMEITESILIQERGPAKCFTNFPRKLFIVD